MLGTLDFKGLEHWVACEQTPHLLEQSLSSPFGLRGRGRLYTGQALGFRQLFFALGQSCRNWIYGFFTLLKEKIIASPKKKETLTLVEWREHLLEDCGWSKNKEGLWEKIK